MSRTPSRQSSRESTRQSAEGDASEKPPSRSQSFVENEQSGVWWLYGQARRFFRSYRSRRFEEVKKPVSNAVAPTVEAPQPRSLLRTVSAFFTRGQDNESGPSAKCVAPSAPPLADRCSPSRGRPTRLRWRHRAFAKRDDGRLDGGLSGSDSSNERGRLPAGPRETMSDHEYTIRRSASSASLSSTPMTAPDILDADPFWRDHHNRVVGSSPSRSRRSSLDDTRSERNSDRRPMNSLIQRFTAFRRGDSEGQSDESSNSPFAKAAGGRDRGGPNTGRATHYSPTRDWLHNEDDAGGSDSNSSVREGRFFNFRNKISSLRRILPPSKNAPANADGTVKGVRRFRLLSCRRSSHSEREDERYSSGTDYDRSPRLYRSSFHGDHPGSGSYWRLDSASSRDESGAHKSTDSNANSPLERVVVLTSNPQPEFDLVPICLTKWTAEAVLNLEDTFSSIPLLRETPLANRGDVFQRKLIACQTVIDFNSKKVLQRAIELKRQTLLEIIEYISTTRNCMNESVLRDVIDMVAANVFRSLPPRTKKSPFSNEIDEEEPTLEISWPHLQIVYDMFLRVIVSNEVSSKMAKNMIDKPFVLKLLSVLNSEDQRERDYLKTILHRIYGKIMPLRTFIRKSIDNLFTHFIYETENPYGITELLEILGSIINGFAVPLKEEHKIYLEKSLTPLHKPSSVRSYHAALSYCMIQYVNKDRSLASVVLRAILKFWPTTSAQAEVLFLNEMEEVLNLTESTELSCVVRPVSVRLAQCVSSSHFQVAERALYVWNNDRVSRLLSMHKREVYPYIAPALKQNIESHWNDAVRALTLNVAARLSDYDPELYLQCTQLMHGSRSGSTASLTPLGSFCTSVVSSSDSPSPPEQRTSSHDTEEQ
ncbi:protein phosphatase B regulatory subunit, putative [Babesia bigemina]|uniref:Protein phosphatase B regulatory subunit, putative n=1 Tax=Babesia bigemina TaxID=5866 RepID=A0A061DBE2_BABBI|nr:protein phosphatase B regulatory subunit, putative [Babesia bigemina]CDR97848.1 protein phosphatase B regulatory subunit, putative [Babesia bigemina]|eukprot:XP_012770034.1 protein phosphatase B regulatory subunit, putative [Babesia bigemina]